MTMTPTNQTPSECKHFDRKQCTVHKGTCGLMLPIAEVFNLDCPGYEPKEKKDGR